MDSLGEAMNVKQVARLIGCSAWTVRQKHLRQGLPCFRSGPSGRLTFYRNQVVAWILDRQKETQGGKIL
jgi:phage terminase Nu1 subunit (DNA packaging protein)